MTDHKMDTRGDNENTELGIRASKYTLRVFSPKTLASEGREYTTYCIDLQTTSSAFRLQRSRTWRRFSDFVWLRKELDKVDNWKSAPSLPSKRFWNVLDPKFVETRRRHLQQWIHEVLSEPLFLSSTALHLFLQTELCVQDIQDYLEGKMTDSVMEDIWNNQGKLYNYQAYNLLHNSFRQEPMEIHHSLDIPHPRDLEEVKQTTHPLPPSSLTESACNTPSNSLPTRHQGSADLQHPAPLLTENGNVSEHSFNDGGNTDHAVLKGKRINEGTYSIQAC